MMKKIFVLLVCLIMVWVNVCARQTIVHFVLDESGSMESIKEDTITGFNEYVQSMKKKDAVVTLTKFNGCGTTVMARPKLSKLNYNPNCNTPLYDAVVKSIFAVDAKVEELTEVCKCCNSVLKPAVLFVILSDGKENASENSVGDVAAMIKAGEEQGWTFVYMGCNQDTFKESSNIMIYGGNTLDWGEIGIRGCFDAVTNCSADFLDNKSIQTEGFFQQPGEIKK